jgi:hypothetical protein
VGGQGILEVNWIGLVGHLAVMNLCNPEVCRFGFRNCLLLFLVALGFGVSVASGGWVVT